MKDAGIEAKRDDPALTTTRGLSASLGQYDALLRSTLAEATVQNVVQRIWRKDASLWKSDSAHEKIIANSLGWLTVTGGMLKVTNELKAFADRIRAEGFRHVMVCGMGGSSLCPDVLRRTFGAVTDFPQLLVLDSTDPDAISNFATQIDIAHCLFVIASKSGTTTEPNAFHKYWYHEVSKKSSKPGDSFVAITDPNTQMVETARAENFKHIFLNQSDIGGRYSALSYFGMTPAALMGLDVDRFLRAAEAMAESCKQSDPTSNPAAQLGAILGSCAKAGRDKVTLVTDKKLAALGLWVEQLIAESTGKEGKGIVPVVGEPLAPASAYGNDRLFVHIAVGAIDDDSRSALQTLEAAGHPVVYRTLEDAYALGAEFFLWEMATAVAGWRLGINPFDQPNVQESKDATKALLEQFARDGKLQESPALASDGFLTVYGAKETTSADSVADLLRAHVGKIRAGDYVALLAYVEESPDTDAALQEIRLLLRDATHCATTTGYGPRFLHSTGQLHKGGPDTGVFIQLTAADQVDMEVPGETYTFSVLKQAQAQGDFQSLLAHGRRAIRVDLGKEVLVGLAKLKELLAKL
jgi:glucose-6-phosphate isomerase